MELCIDTNAFEGFFWLILDMMANKKLDSLLNIAISLSVFSLIFVCQIAFKKLIYMLFAVVKIYWINKEMLKIQEAFYKEACYCTFSFL